VYERARVEYISFYWSLLLAWSSHSTVTSCPSRASDLLTAVLTSSNKFQSPASVYWLETSSVLAYLTLVRQVFDHATLMSSQSPLLSSLESPPLSQRLVTDLMREYYLTLETIFTNKRQLFCCDLKERCLSLLFELFESIHKLGPQSPRPVGRVEAMELQEGMPSERELSALFEWCSNQGWGVSVSVQGKRGRPPIQRVSRLPSQSSAEGDSPQPGPSQTSDTPSFNLHSPSELTQSSSRKRGRSGSESGFTPLPLTGTDGLGKKRRAITRVQQLLVCVSPTNSPQQPKISTSPTQAASTLDGVQPQNHPPHTAQSSSNTLSARSPSTQRIQPISLPKFPPPPLPINILRPPLPTSLLRPPLPKSLLRPGPPRTTPSVPAPVPTSSVGSTRGLKEKKRRAILRLREIFHHDRVAWQASVRGG
jgi:hypothetical protein